jgi:hypothetical protein
MPAALKAWYKVLRELGGYLSVGYVAMELKRAGQIIHVGIG